MDRSKVAAFALALVVCGVVLAIGTSLILSSGSPQQPAEWTPFISPYVDDRASLYRTKMPSMTSATPWN